MKNLEEIVKDPLRVKELFQCEKFLIGQLTVRQESDYKEYLRSKFLEVSKLTSDIRQLIKANAAKSQTDTSPQE